MKLDTYDTTPSQITRSHIELIASQNWPNLKVEHFPILGRGVIVTKEIPKGTMICNYHGEIFTKQQMEDHLASLSENEAIQISRYDLYKNF